MFISYRLFFNLYTHFTPISSRKILVHIFHLSLHMISSKDKDRENPWCTGNYSIEIILYHISHPIELAFRWIQAKLREMVINIFRVINKFWALSEDPASIFIPDHVLVQILPPLWWHRVLIIQKVTVFIHQSKVPLSR